MIITAGSMLYCPFKQCPWDKTKLCGTVNFSDTFYGSKVQIKCEFTLYIFAF